MMLSVEELRSMGFIVVVKHERKYDAFGCMKPKGGNTIVELITPDGVNVVGKSRCSRRDSYNKKLGVKIALGRALS